MTELPPQDIPEELHLLPAVGAAVIAHVTFSADARNDQGTEPEDSYMRDVLCTIENHTGIAPNYLTSRDLDEIRQLVRSYVTFSDQ
jgi:hypothetical protein